MRFQNIVGNNGNPQSDTGEVKEQVIAGKLCLRCEGHAVFNKKLMEKFTGCACFIQHQNGILSKLFQRKTLFLKVEKFLSCHKDILKFLYSTVLYW